MTLSKVIVFFCGMLLLEWCFIVSAYSSGIKIGYIDLASMLAGTRTALLVTVVSVDLAKQQLHARIEKIYGQGFENPPAPGIFENPAGKRLPSLPPHTNRVGEEDATMDKIGTLAVFDFHQKKKGKPHRWVLDERYWAELPLTSLKPKHRVFLIHDFSSGQAPVRAIADTPNNLRKIELFLTPHWQDAYQQNTVREQLVMDFSDPDLMDTAYPILKTKLWLTDTMLLDSARSMETVDLVARHCATLTASDLDAFLHNAMLYLRKSPDVNLIYRFRNLFNSDELVARHFPALLAFYLLLSPNVNDEFEIKKDLARGQINRYLNQATAPTESEKCMEDFLTDFYSNRRNTYISLQAGLEHYYTILPVSKRAHWLTFIQQLMVSTTIPGQGPDQELVNLLEKLHAQ